jgi:hypothetical protein
MNVDVSPWSFVGETVNTKFYRVEDDVLAGVPNDGARDDGASARENIAFQNDYLRRLGRPGVIVVFFDRMISQDREARRVYQTEVDATCTLASCLVGGTALARAMASFSLGFTKQRIPVKMFPNLDEALAWSRTLPRPPKESR